MHNPLPVLGSDAEGLNFWDLAWADKDGNRLAIEPSKGNQKLLARFLADYERDIAEFEARNAKLVEALQSNTEHLEHILPKLLVIDQHPIISRISFNKLLTQQGKAE